MTTDVEVYETLKYCVEVDPKTGACRYRNAAGQLHREAGPAVILKNGSTIWFSCGELHREDGPAVTWGNGTKEWWLHGVEYTEEGFRRILKRQNRYGRQSNGD